jgi:hypothetical protein
MSEEVIVTSVRYNGRSITCKWDQGGDACSRTFHDNPLPSFVKALEALKSHVCDLCELPAKDEEKIEVKGITINALGDDNQQSVIVATKKLKRAKRVMNITTPLLAMWEPKKKDADPGDRMDEATAKAIAKVEAETKKYICGERAQGKLALEEEKPKKKKEAGAETAAFPGMEEPEGKN